MCCNKRRAAAYRGYPPSLEAGGPAFGPPFGRRGCGSGQRRPGLIQKLVTKAIEKRNEKMEARQQLESERQVPQQSVTRVDEKREPAGLQQGHSRAQPVKIVFDDGHEEWVSDYTDEKESGVQVGEKRGEHPPRYSELMKT
ncbi:hypothetical protein KVR01_006443 [Diaporthe batatas]|uniref:uncharacterized protein n=1 Tax=Diaporthe batatas TaxID=748121 RepID=UPI001D04AAC3|nr:uncharacterized protein KVR01_006443 [Diaporthe batatas]KAG8164525.1 hypothetical protein KVR01_006443 [Diaporthe batatas]